MQNLRLLGLFAFSLLFWKSPTFQTYATASSSLFTNQYLRNNINYYQSLSILVEKSE